MTATGLPLITARQWLDRAELRKRLASLTGLTEAAVQSAIQAGLYAESGEYRAPLFVGSQPPSFGVVSFSDAVVIAESREDGTWSVTVEASAHIATTGEPPRVTATVPVTSTWSPYRSDLLEFTAASSGAPLATLQALSTIGAPGEVTTAMKVARVVAPQLPSDPGIVQIDLVLAEDGLFSSRVYFDAATNWTIVEGTFEVVKLTAGVGRRWSNGIPGEIALGLAGEVKIGDYTFLSASITVPDVGIRASLDTDQSAPTLGQFLGDLGLGEEFWPDLTIRSLELAYEPALGHHKLFDFAVNGSWEILPGLALEQLALHLEESEQNQVKNRDLRFDSKLRFFQGRPEEFALQLHAQYSALLEGQTYLVMSAAMAPGKPILLGALIQDLLQRVGIDLTLPGPLHDLAVTDFHLGIEILRETQPGEKGPVQCSSRRLSAGFTVQSSSGKWELVPGLIEFEPARIDLLLGSSLDVSIQETIRLFDGDWRVSLQVPSLCGSVELLTGDLPLAPAFDHFHLPTTGLEGLKLRDATLQFDAHARAVSLHLQLADVWEHGCFELKDVQFGIDYRGGQGGGAAASFTALSVVERSGGDIEMRLSGVHAGPGLGWAMEGSVNVEGRGLGLPDVAKHFGMSQDQIAGLSPLTEFNLVHLGVRYDTHTKELAADCTIHVSDGAQIRLAIERRPIDHAVSGDQLKDPAQFELRFSGVLEAGGVEFDLLFRKDGKGTYLLGVYVDHGGGAQLLQAIASAVGKGDHPDLGGVSFPLKSAMIAWHCDAALANPNGGDTEKSDKKSDIVFAADMDVGVDLSGLGDLPLVGSAFDDHNRLTFGFSPVYATTALDDETLKTLRSLAPPGSPILPDKLSNGLTLVTTCMLGQRRLQVNLPGLSGANKVDPKLGSPRTARNANGRTAVAVAPIASQTALQWIVVQKVLGKVLNLRRIGLGMRGSEVHVAFDGAIQVGPLVLDIMGLEARYDTSSHDISFALQGLGFELKAGSVELGASFANLDGDFVGRAVLRMGEFGLAALGAFTQKDGRPSMFLFGVLTAPLGGPVFFFVEGLAAGFGFDRDLRMPPIEEVDRFPFVAEAMGTLGPPKLAPGSKDPTGSMSLGEELFRLHEYVSPSVGCLFLAVGLKFNSFRIVDVFALVVAMIDLTRQHVRLALLGLANLQLPSDSPEVIAYIQLNILATVDPMEGTAVFQAQLTPRSWILSPDCHLQGGFAAGFWFLGEHAGDFVYTLGGFHPHFPAPSHYPRVPRLGFRWSVCPTLNVRGELYYALTPVAAMAGGFFQANWNGGGLSAWYELGADFLIQWKPLHYEASAHVEIGASYDTVFGTITGSLGADVEIWGPEFAGSAHFKFGPIHFAVDFGGDRKPHSGIPWDDFHVSFLPSDKPLCAGNVLGGLVRVIEVGDDKKKWAVVDPRRFLLDISTVVPITNWRVDGKEQTIDAPITGVAPMDRKEAWPNKAGIAIKHGSAVATDEFTVRLEKKAFPAALWGKEFQNPDSQSILQAPGSVSIVPAKLPAPGVTAPIQRADLSFEPYPISVQPAIDAPVGGTEMPRDSEDAQQKIEAALITELDSQRGRRAEVLAGLGFDAARESSITGRYVHLLRATPRMLQH